MAENIFLDKTIGCVYDIRCRAEIFLHQQYLRARMPVLKLQQRLRIGRTKSVDALILIADQKQILGPRRQKRKDGMLDLGSILRFIDAEIGILPLKIG